MIGRLETRVGIVGVGSAVPVRVVSNDELSATIDTTDEWIVTRTGIRERRVVSGEESTTSLALAAAEQALDRSGVAPAELDLVIVATATPDAYFPSTAALIADSLGAHSAACFDLSAACTGFVYALAQAIGQLEAGLAQRALVVGAESMSKLVDWTDRATCVLFGDGAGAVVLAADALAAPATLAIELGADGSRAADLYAQALVGDDKRLRMNGREVFKFATRVMVDSSLRVLEAAGAEAGAVDVWIPHQANIRIIDHAVKRLGIDRGRVVTNLDRYGNTSAASVPLCIAEAWEQGRLSPGDRVLMVGFGAGLTWGSCLIEWAAAQPAADATAEDR